jgi:hypothetical protein
MCASAVSTIPNAAVGRLSSGSIACADTPAMSARVVSPAKCRRTSRSTELSARNPKASHCEGMRRPPKRSQNGVFQGGPRSHDRANQLPIGWAVATESVRRLFNRSVRDRTVSAVERMRQHDSGFQPFQTELIERERAKKWRGGSKRVHGRTHIVHEAGQCEFRRSGAASDGWLSLEDDDLAAGLRENDGRSQTVRSRANDDRIELAHTSAATAASETWWASTVGPVALKMKKPGSGNPRTGPCVSLAFWQEPE